MTCPLSLSSRRCFSYHQNTTVQTKYVREAERNVLRDEFLMWDDVYPLLIYYAVQSYTVLCCSMLWCSKLHHRILRVITLCNILLYLLLSCAIQCCAALSSAALCCIIFCCIIYSSDRDHRKYCVKLFYQICH